MLISGWNATPGSSADFEATLRRELDRGGEPAELLRQVQPTWMAEQEDPDPRVWARYSCYVGS